MAAAPVIGIYKITSPSGKIYIGQSVNIQMRKDKYRLFHCKGQVRLYASFIKYGFENHVFEVVEECGVDRLSILERHYQDIYDSVGENGLNCKATRAPGRVGYHSESTKNNIRLGKLGKKISESHRQSLIRCKASVSEETKEKIRRFNTGRIISDATKQKHRIRLLGNKLTAGVVPVNAIKVVDTATGRVYASIRVAASHIGMKRRTLQAKLTGQNHNNTSLKYQSL